MQSFFRNTKRWGKFEFRPILLPKFELTFLTSVGNITVETGDAQWEIYVDEIKVTNYDTDYDTDYSSYLRYEPMKLVADVPENLPKRYRSALRSVSTQIKYWKTENAHWQTLISSAKRACAKCTHSRKTTWGCDAGPAVGPLTAGLLTSSDYMCHRYPVSVPVTAMHECGEFQPQ